MNFMSSNHIANHTISIIGLFLLLILSGCKSNSELEQEKDEHISNDMRYVVTVGYYVIKISFIVLKARQGGRGGAEFDPFAQSLLL